MLFYSSLFCSRKANFYVIIDSEDTVFCILCIVRMLECAGAWCVCVCVCLEQSLGTRFLRYKNSYYLELLYFGAAYISGHSSHRTRGLSAGEIQTITELFQRRENVPSNCSEKLAMHSVGYTTSQPAPVRVVTAEGSSCRSFSF